MDTKRKVVKPFNFDYRTGNYTLSDGNDEEVVAYGQQLNESIMAKINKICADANEWQLWAAQEIQFLKDRIEELETELMLVENDIESTLPQHKGILNLKKRSMFK